MMSFSPSRVKEKTIKLIFAAFLLTTPHLGLRAKISWLRESGKCVLVERYVSQSVV